MHFAILDTTLHLERILSCSSVDSETARVVHEIGRLFLDAIAAFLGGLALTAALFWFGERVFPTPQISGRWFFQTFTEESARNSFKGMLLKREVLIWQEGATIRGTCEKIYESSSTGRRQYEGTRRVRGDLSGYANRSVFSSNRVRIHLTEKADERTSTSYFDVISEKGSFWKRLLGFDVRRKGANGLIQEHMHGIFQSMAGSSSGKTIWSRNRYDPIFESDVRNEESDIFGVIDEMAAEAGYNEPD